MLQSKIPYGVLAVGVTTVAAAWLTKPKPYPPRDWSEEANKFPDPIKLGLGPFFYHCEEKGATTPVDRVTDAMRERGIEDLEMAHMMKPGLDTNTDGFVLVSGKSFERVKERMKQVSLKFSRNTKFDHVKSGSLFPNLIKPLPNEPPVSVSIRLNMSGDFNSVVSFDNRRKNEAIICDVLAQTVGGKYHPLCGNQSREHSGTRSMSEQMLDVLRSQNLMFEAPWTTFDLSAGFGRHWPDARGVWVVESTTDSQIVVWINHEDHVEIVGSSNDGVNLVKRLENFRNELAQKLPNVAKSEEFGYLSVKPEFSGNNLTVSQTVRLGRLGMHEKFSSVTRLLGLRVTDLGDRKYHLVSTERFGISAEEATARAVVAFRIIANLDPLSDATPVIEKLLKFS